MIKINCNQIKYFNNKKTYNFFLILLMIIVNKKIYFIKLSYLKHINEHPLLYYLFLYIIIFLTD